MIFIVVCVQFYIHSFFNREMYSLKEKKLKILNRSHSLTLLDTFVT